MHNQIAQFLALACFAIATTGHAASLTFSGTVIAVTIDDGTGVFAGTVAGTTFSGSFSYPDSAGPSTIDEVDEANYELTGSSSLVRAGTTTVSGTDIGVNIQDNQPLDADTADFFNALLAPDPATAAGQLIDGWTVTGLQAGAFEQDPDPGDADDTELLYNGVGYEFTLLSRASALFDSLVYRPLPPAPGATEFQLFVVREGDAAGNLIFEAYGTIDASTAVPAPPTLALLATAVLGLAGRRLVRAPTVPASR